MEAKRNIHEEVRWNKIKTYLIMSIFIFMIAILGYFLGILYGTPIFGFGMAIFGAIFYTIIMYAQGSNIILKTTSAPELTKKKKEKEK